MYFQRTNPQLSTYNVTTRIHDGLSATNKRYMVQIIGCHSIIIDGIS